MRELTVAEMDVVGGGLGFSLDDEFGGAFAAIPKQEGEEMDFPDATGMTQADREREQQIEIYRQEMINNIAAGVGSVINGYVNGAGAGLAIGGVTSVGAGAGAAIGCGVGAGAATVAIVTTPPKP